MNDDYPEDWQEQGWCCRECAVTAWNGMSLEMRRYFAAEVAAQRTLEGSARDGNRWTQPTLEAS